MSFYRDLMEADRISEGLDPLTPSHAATMLALARLEDMTPEEKTAKASRLDAVFEAILQDWGAKGFTAVNRNLAEMRDRLGNVS